MNFKEGLDGDHGKTDCDMDGGGPSDALLLALGYLRLRDLLAVESLCKSLRDAVRGDPLLWRSIRIGHIFHTKITDDILIKLTNRAQGHLLSLSLYHSKITDVGLMHVPERNPSLDKLSVPGCMRLTADGILSNLKVLKTAGKIRLKYLGIYGLFGVTSQHLEEFKLLIGVDNSKLPTTCKPRFFGSDQLWVTSDDRAVDIEVCPKCQKLELVYDCPSESCQKKQSSTQLCRACTTCIARCINCGCCLSGYLLCLDCWRQPLVAKRGSRKDLFV
ncbi:F-box protein SKIP14-like isoform X1 [Lycium ferocissimum]|uniref:F-box protein SKIP14-like isoform X1 n=1 Tax=Lycium ferocissimum TaxID=112874 RepID=UPI002815C9AE|nr:F-box protein SKIP14-like isoform X1 [Lycium ferocissimum]